MTHKDRSDIQIQPDAKNEKRQRRKFSAKEKLRIVLEADVCKHGEIGALLRREKIYSNQLLEWRREYDKDGLSGLSKSSHRHLRALSSVKMKS